MRIEKTLQRKAFVCHYRGFKIYRNHCIVNGDTVPFFWGESSRANTGAWNSVHEVKADVLNNYILNGTGLNQMTGMCG